jgi:hypothetical protein
MLKRELYEQPSLSEMPRKTNENPAWKRRRRRRSVVWDHKTRKRAQTNNVGERHFAWMMLIEGTLRP